MAGPYTYAIGPVVEVDGVYRPPTGCISWIDLRSLGQQSALGQTGCGFFTMPSNWSVPTGYEGLGGGTGDCRSLYFSASDQSAWASLIGTTIPRDASTTVAEALRLQLTDYAVPDGSSGPKPLQPGSPPPGPPPQGEIILAGHSAIWRVEAPALGRGRWGSNLRDLIRADLQRHADQIAPGRIPDHWRKVLGGLKQKYGLAWDDPDENDFLPPGLRGRDPSNPSDPRGKRRKAVKPETSISEDFNGTNGVLGNLLTWDTTNKGNPTWANNSNKLRITQSGGGSDRTIAIRAESDLSSADHYAQYVYDANTNVGDFGPTARHDSTSAKNWYSCDDASGSGGVTYKVVAGTRTQLGSQFGSTGGGVTRKIHVNGSTITGYTNATSDGGTTDTAISSGTRCGIKGYQKPLSSEINDLDNWEAADLSGGGTTPARLMLLGVG